MSLAHHHRIKQVRDGKDEQNSLSWNCLTQLFDTGFLGINLLPGFFVAMRILNTNFYSAKFYSTEVILKNMKVTVEFKHSMVPFIS